MKISVITVCLNSAKTLSRTLDSVVNQDYPEIEHIVIDGGSIDGSLEILATYSDKLAHVTSQPDKGIYDAMNKGMDLATGDIFCFLNADDHYASSKVLSLVSSKMNAGNLDVLIGDVSFFHERSPSKVTRRYRSDRFHPGRLSWGWMPAHPAMFITQKTVKRVGKFETNYRIAGDFEFIIRVFSDQSLKYTHISEVLVNMQTGGVSTRGIKSTITLNKEVLRACRQNRIKTNIFKILLKYPIKFLEFL